MPTDNLNNAAGPDRSNVSWAQVDDDGAPGKILTGDDFTLGSSSQFYRVNHIRTWAVEGKTTTDPFWLGNVFTSVSLYGAPAGQALKVIAKGNLTSNSNTTDNPDISITEVRYTDGSQYEGSDGTYRIYQLDFENLNWLVPGGTKIYFAPDGVGVEPTSWYNHASNKDMSGNAQAGADDLYLSWLRSDLADVHECDSSDPTHDPFCSGGWDKSSDINVQVWAEALPAPSTVYVNAAWASTPALTDPDESGPAIAMGYDAFATIQEGVDAVAEGGTVNVAAGTYEENLAIEKPLNLQGAGPDTTTIRGVNTGDNISTIYISTSGAVSVSGFKVINAPATNTTDHRFGIRTNSPVSGVTYTINHNTILGTNNADNSEDYGIYGENGGKENLIITGNTISQTGANNILVESHLGSTTITSNTLDAGVYGTDAIFIMTHDTGNDVSNLQAIRDNTIDMGTGSGTSSATGITIAAVGDTYGVQPAKFLAGSVEISGNTINNLKENRRGIGFWNDAADGHGADGEILSPVVTGNTITAVTGKPTGSMGIDTIGLVSDGEITHNTINGANLCFKERIWNNHIASGTLFNDNTCVSTNGVVTERTSGSLDATNNWWGEPTGPGLNLPNVTYSPWCSVSDCTHTATGEIKTLSSGDSVSTDGASATYTGEGSADVILAVYDANPEASQPAFISGSFYDVKVSELTDPEATLSVTFPVANPASHLRYWTGTAWVLVKDNNGIMPVAVDGSMTVVFGPNSTPKLSELTGTPIVVADPYAIQVQFNKNTVQVGNTVTATVIAKAYDLYGVEVNLDFDKEHLQVQSVTLPDWARNITPGFINKGDYDNVAGTISFGYTQLQPAKPKAGDDIVLATITFKAIAAADHAGVSLSTESPTQFTNQELQVVGDFPTTLIAAKTPWNVTVTALPTYQIFLPVISN